ncbi:MAG: InlB B-repeat-containing protein [Mycoplasmoidaceae bacterium]|nr:InlB B-repeat-containing protein [Mycoplasmoidaceae bacterium]
MFTSCQSVNNYLITFNSQGGSFVQPQMIESGGVISIPDEPTKPSCNFGG